MEASFPFVQANALAREPSAGDILNLGNGHFVVRLLQAAQCSPPFEVDHPRAGLTTLCDVVNLVDFALLTQRWKICTRQTVSDTVAESHVTTVIAFALSNTSDKPPMLSISMFCSDGCGQHDVGSHVSGNARLDLALHDVVLVLHPLAGVHLFRVSTFKELNSSATSLRPHTSNAVGVSLRLLPRFFASFTHFT